MEAWKYSPNTYDVNLVKRHDDNSAINSSIRDVQRLSRPHVPWDGL